MSDQKTWQPTPEQMIEIMNLDGLLSRGQIHPVDYISRILAAGPDWQSIAVDLANGIDASWWGDWEPLKTALERYRAAGEKP